MASPDAQDLGTQSRLHMASRFARGEDAAFGGAAAGAEAGSDSGPSQKV